MNRARRWADLLVKKTEYQQIFDLLRDNVDKIKAAIR
jgi:hypothetical protein